MRSAAVDSGILPWAYQLSYLAYELMEKAGVMKRELREGKQRLTAAMQESHHQQGEHMPSVVRELRAEIEPLRAEIRELSRKVVNH